MAILGVEAGINFFNKWLYGIICVIDTLGKLNKAKI